MGHKFKFASLIAGAAFSVSSAHAQLSSTLGNVLVQQTEPAPTPQPVPLPQRLTNTSGEFILAPYERLEAYANGCNVLATNGEAGYYGAYRWYGRCRAGLADGWGYQIYKDPSAPGGFFRIKMHLGKMVAYDLPVGTIITAVTIPSGPGRPASETISNDDAPKRQTWEKAGDFVGDRGGKGTAAILTRSASIDDREMRVDHIWLAKAECPQPYSKSMEKALAESYYGQKLQPELWAKVAPVCKKAISRAKSEGVITNSFSISAYSPFERVDYGYYFVVFQEYVVTPRKGNETGYYTGPASTKVIQSALCPQITSLAGCETVWRAMQAPFVEKRDAMAAMAPKIAADDAADRERRATGSHDRLASYAARLAADAPAYAPPSAPQATATPEGKDKP